MYEACATMTK